MGLLLSVTKNFCDVGDKVEASKVWNLMVDEGFQLNIDAGWKPISR